MSPARKLAAGMAVFYWLALSFATTALAATESVASSTPPALIGGDLLDVLQNRYLLLAEKGRTAVVKVNAAVRTNPGDASPTNFVWSGFFIGRNGDIITNNAHHLQNAMRVWVDYNGVIYPADVIGCDPVTDVGLLHLAILPKNFNVLDLAESPDLPPIGTMLLAVTSKLGQPPGPSPGIIQGYNTNIGEVDLHTVHLRVNIPDDGGEGGSPVLDLHGRLVGIIVASLQDSRSSLVLPSRAIMRIRDELLVAVDHRVHYGLFGFDVNQENSTDSAPHLVIKSVDYGGPALAAGLKAGDVLNSVGGVPLQNNNDLHQAWFFSHPGQDLAIVVQRDGAEVQLTLHVGEMPVASSAPDAVTVAQNIDPDKAATANGSPGPASPLGSKDNDQPAPPVDKKLK